MTNDLSNFNHAIFDYSMEPNAPVRMSLYVSPNSLVTRLNRLLADVTYRPDWTITAQDNPTGMAAGPTSYPVLVIKARVIDSNPPHGPTLIVHSIPLPEPGSRYHDALVSTAGDDELLELIFRYLSDVERHESREFFKFKGERWRDPHRDGNAHLYR